MSLSPSAGWRDADRGSPIFAGYLPSLVALLFVGLPTRPCSWYAPLSLLSVLLTDERNSEQSILRHFR
jgi:hypothetical protein